VREYEYKFDDDSIQDEGAREPDYFDEYAEPHEYDNEMARSAVERFLEAETADDDISEHNRKSTHIRHDEMTEPEGIKRSTSAKKLDDDEEYMTRLADARRERQRRKEQNPVPKPAVRVNAERPRRSHSLAIEKPPTDEEWTPMAEEDFESFRKRYNEPHVMAPREAKAKSSERTRKKTVSRRSSERPTEGPNPLRYLLVAVALFVLGVMMVMAFNNRNLRLDVARLEASATGSIEDAAEIVSLSLAIEEYRHELASLQEDFDAQYNLLLEHGIIAGDDYVGDDYTPPVDTTPTRPEDEAEPPPQPPAEPPPPPQPPAPVTHIVQQGQFLSHIAFAHFGSSATRYVELIANANNLAYPFPIQIGQELTIPVLE